MTATTQETSRQTKSTSQVAIPPGLADVAYIDAGGIAAAAAMSISQWHALVKVGNAPKPAIRKPRFTRWLLSDVRAWLIQFSSQSDYETDSEIVLSKATKASHAAKAKAAANRQLQQQAA